MALQTIYGNFQTAGIPVVATGKSSPPNDGTAPLAQAVVLVDASGALVPSGYSAENITTNDTTVITATLVHGLSVNTGGTTSTAEIRDGTDGSGTLLATVDTTAIGNLTFDITLTTGLVVVTAGAVAADVTVTYR